MSHRQAKEQPVQENPAPIDPDPRPRDDVPVYHKSAQKTDTSNGAEENTGEPTNNTPEQNADVPPDSRVPKRDAVYRSLSLGESVVQMLYHMGRIFEDTPPPAGGIPPRTCAKKGSILSRERIAPFPAFPTSGEGIF